MKAALLSTRLERQAQAIARQRAMRTFLVRLADDTEVRIEAHFNDMTNPGGHLLFTTFDLDGRALTHNAFNAREWVSVQEITAPNTQGMLVH